MKYERIIFWQESPSPHQAPWIRVLAEKVIDCQVICIFHNKLATCRIALGWQLPDYGKAQVLISPEVTTVNKLIGCNPETTLHVFSGMVHDPVILAYFRRMLSSDAYIGILSEGRDWRGWKGVLRQVHAWFHECRYRHSVDFILAVGGVGVRWFNQCGFEPKRIFPFCYAVEKHGYRDFPPIPVKPVRLTAVGQLIPRKRIDLLFEALAKAPHSGWTLSVVGDGALRHSLELTAERLGIDARVVFRGVMDNQQVMHEHARTDLLILPSRWDGWGAVVNEALMSGVPVICSDYCGAADLIRPGFNGELFRCDSLDSLIQALDKWISQGPLTLAQRDEIKLWARCIEGEAVADYFLKIIDHIGQFNTARPKAPWEKS